MRLARLRTTALGCSAVAAITVFACTETPTGDAPATSAERVAFSQADGKDKQKVKLELQYARVKADGTLVDGTAVSVQRFSTGVYLVKFPPPIGGCAASANSASFQGFDNSVFRITAQISIGFGAGGSFDDQTVGVSLFNTSSALNENSSFTLILVCP